MLGTSGTLKVVSDLSSVIELIEGVKSGDLDNLKAIRDELSNSISVLQDIEQRAKERLEKAQDADKNNEARSIKLDLREVELNQKDMNLKAVVANVTSVKDALIVEKDQLKSDRDAFNKAQSDWTEVQNKRESDFQISVKELKDKSDARERSLDKREKDLTVRENQATIKETNLFKQSQLASEFLKSVRQ